MFSATYVTRLWYFIIYCKSNNCNSKVCEFNCNFAQFSIDFPVM